MPVKNRKIQRNSVFRTEKLHQNRGPATARESFTFFFGGFFFHPGGVGRAGGWMTMVATVADVGGGADGAGIADVHRAVVQFMVRARVVPARVLAQVFGQLQDSHGSPDSDPDAGPDRGPDGAVAGPPSEQTPEDLEAAVTAINNSLHDLGFMVKKHRHAASGELHYVFINTGTDDVSRAMTLYSPKEIAGVNKLLDTMVAAPETSLGAAAALKAVMDTQNTSFSKNDALALLQTLVRDRWLDSDADGTVYTASTRMLAEMGDAMRVQDE